MSWSTLLGRSLSCPPDADRGPPSDAESRQQQRVDAAANNGSASSTRQAADNDAELDALIRACANTDAGMLDDIGDFGLDVDVDDGDSLDLTIYGIGLRPPDWWSSLCNSFDSGSGSTLSSGGDAQRRALNTPSPGPATQDGQQASSQQQPPHPWAENSGCTTMPSFDSSLETLGLLLGDPQSPFDCDVTDDF